MAEFRTARQADTRAALEFAISDLKTALGHLERADVDIGDEDLITACRTSVLYMIHALTKSAEKL